MIQQQPNAPNLDIQNAQQNQEIFYDFPVQVFGNGYQQANQANRVQNIVSQNNQVQNIVSQNNQPKIKRKLMRTQKRKKLIQMKQKKRVRREKLKWRKFIQQNRIKWQKQKQKFLNDIQKMQEEEMNDLPYQQREIIKQDKQQLIEQIQYAEQLKKNAQQLYLQRIQQLQNQVQTLKQQNQDKQLPGFFQFFKLKLLKFKKSFDETILSIQNSLKKKYQQRKNRIRNYIRNFKQAIKNGVKKRVQSIKRAYNQGGQLLNQINRQLNEKVVITKQKMKQWYHNQQNMVKNGLSALGNGIGQGAMLLGTGALLAGQGVIQAGKGIGKGVKYIGQQVLNAGKMLGKGIKYTGQGVGKGIKYVGQGLLNTGKSIGKGVQLIGNNLGSGLSYIGQQIGHGGSYVASGIKKGVSSLGNGIVTGTKYIGSGIDKTGRKIGQSINQGYQFVKNKIKGRQKTDQEKAMQNNGFFANVWNSIKDKGKILKDMTKRIGSWLSASATDVAKFLHQLIPIQKVQRIIRTVGLQNLPYFLQNYVFTQPFWAIVGSPLPGVVTQGIKSFVNHFLLGPARTSFVLPTYLDHLKANGAAGAQQMAQFGLLGLAKTANDLKNYMTDGFIDRTPIITNPRTQTFGSRATGADQYDWSAYGPHLQSKQDLQKQMKAKNKQQTWGQWWDSWGWGQFLPGNLRTRSLTMRPYGPTNVHVYDRKNQNIDNWKQYIQKNHYGPEVLRVLQKKVEQKYALFHQRRQQMLKTGELTQKQYQQKLKQDNKTIQKYIQSLQNLHRIILYQIKQIKQFISDPRTQYMNGMFFIKQNGTLVKNLKVPIQLIPYLDNWKKQINFDQYMLKRLLDEDIKKVNTIQQQIQNQKTQQVYDNLPFSFRFSNTASQYGGALKNLAYAAGNVGLDFLERYVIPPTVTAGLKSLGAGLSNLFGTQHLFNQTPPPPPQPQQQPKAYAQAHEQKTKNIKKQEKKVKKQIQKIEKTMAKRYPQPYIGPQMSKVIVNAPKAVQPPLLQNMTSVIANAPKISIKNNNSAKQSYKAMMDL